MYKSICYGIRFAIILSRLRFTVKHTIHNLNIAVAKNDHRGTRLHLALSVINLIVTLVDLITFLSSLNAE